MKTTTWVLGFLLLLSSSISASAQQRDQISIVGSSTVYPFATVVAENFGRATQFKAPKVEATGSGGGIKLFCQGVGARHPDIANASRRMKKTEFDQCVANGVKDIIEVVIGYDGIVLANSKKSTPFKLSLKEVFLALAKKVPNPNGQEELVENPYKTWREISQHLPNSKIEVLGPPPTSGTRDAFVELAMEGGCQQFAWIKTIKKQDKKRYKSICHGIREDGAFIEAGENDNLIVKKLEANPNALGIFGFSFLDQNLDRVQGSIINHSEPTFEAIADGSYPVSRPLFFYVKKAHIGQIPGLDAFLAEFTSEKAWGDDGYLSDRGLIPLPQSKRKEVQQAVKSKTSLVL